MSTFLLLAIIALMVVSFALELLPIDVVALLTLALLLAFNLVTPEQAVAGFSNSAVITVMMMFILSEGLVSSGLISHLAYRIASFAGPSPRTASTLVLSLSGVLSAFINNVAAVSIFMPVSLHLAKHYKFSPSRILLPLSYASIFGGTCTLIGTSTNLLVSALADEQGAGPMNMFEFASLGILLFAIGMLYNLFVVQRFLPARDISSSLTRKYNLSSFLTEVKVPEGSKLLGRTVISEQISDRFQINVLEILRGKDKIAQDLRNTRIAPGDVLIVRGALEEIISFKEQYSLLLLTDTKLTDAVLHDENNILVEVQVASAQFEDQTLKGIDFRKRFGCFVLALNRSGELIRQKVAMIPLKRWDTLLVFGPRARVEALYETDDFKLLYERDVRLKLSDRWWVGATIVPLVVLLAASGLMTILEASILGAVAMIVSGAIKVQEAYKAINWTVIFLVAAILPLGTAMHNTGLSDAIGQYIAGLGTALGPLLVLSLIYLATSLLTEIMSNNSTVVLMVPISISVAAGLGVDAKPFLMAVAFAGSASFLTPMGYKTNAMVFGPGGYRFMDYIWVGLPLKVVFWLVSTLLIPVLWSF